MADHMFTANASHLFGLKRDTLNNTLPTLHRFTLCFDVEIKYYSGTLLKSQLNMSPKCKAVSKISKLIEDEVEDDELIDPQTDAPEYLHRAPPPAKRVEPDEKPPTLP